MKLDKEYLVKHHFWFLLATYTPMVLLGLILLWTSVAGAIDGEAKAIGKAKDEVKKYAKGDVKNDKWISAFKAKADKLAKKKNDVWNEVWQGQSTMFAWPTPLAELNNYEYGEDIREAQKRDVYINDKDCYPKQVSDMVAIVQPVNDKGEGVVQYEGGWKKVLTYQPRWLGRERLTLPSSEEIWLAQEDLWIQKELLQTIRDINDGLALYEKAKNPPPRARDELDRQVFENPRWRLELGLTRDVIRWKITNRSPRLQSLALNFRLTFKGKTQDLWVDGLPLAPNQTSKEDTFKLPGAAPSGFDAVAQVLDWRTAPVKRIDQLRLAYGSSSTTGKQLVAYPTFAPKDDPNAAPGGPGGPGAPPGAMQGGMPMPPPPGGERFGPGMPGGPNAKGGNEMGFVKNRYIETTDQVRRMPIGMVLIVDQSHVQDVLTAFAKSRLRFQTTQVEWKRYRGKIQPELVEEGGPAGPGGEMGPKRPKPVPVCPCPCGRIAPDCRTRPIRPRMTRIRRTSSSWVSMGLPRSMRSIRRSLPPRRTVVSPHPVLRHREFRRPPQARPHRFPPRIRHPRRRRRPLCRHPRRANSKIE
jgi:hypothetical protein